MCLHGVELLGWVVSQLASAILVIFEESECDDELQ